MPETRLPRSAWRLLCELYYLYQLNLDSGLDEPSARYFGGADQIAQSLNLDMSPSEVSAHCFALAREGFADVLPADDQAAEVILTPDAIAFMQDRFSRSVSSLLDHLSSLRSLLP